LVDAINRCIPEPRNPFYTVHQQKTMPAQRIFGIAFGYEDLNDHQSLREDPLFQVVSERGVKDDLPLVSPPALCLCTYSAAASFWFRTFVQPFICEVVQRLRLTAGKSRFPYGGKGPDS